VLLSETIYKKSGSAAERTAYGNFCCGEPIQEENIAELNSVKYSLSQARLYLNYRKYNADISCPT
jgi:hypothetical protein